MKKYRSTFCASWPANVSGGQWQIEFFKNISSFSLCWVFLSSSWKEVKYTGGFLSFVPTKRTYSLILMGTLATINEAEKWNGGKINEDKKRHMEMRGR